MGTEQAATASPLPQEAERSSSLPPTDGLLAGKRVAVVGGGPAGMLAAMRLAQHGARVDVYEAREFDYDPAANTWFILLNERGLQSLEAAGIDILSDPSMRFVGAAISYSDGRFTAAQFINARRSLCGNRAMHTRFMQEQALRLCGDNITLHHGCKMLGGNLTAKTLRFQELQSGREFEVQADLIVGADGARSTVRNLMLEQVPGFSVDMQPHFNAVHTFRLPRGPSADDPTTLGKPFQMYPETEAGEAWLGAGTSVHVSLPKPGTPCNVVFNTYKSGRVDGAFTLPKSYWERQWTEEEARALITDSLPQVPLFIVDIMAKTLSNSPQPSPLPTSIKCSQISAPGVLLVGDAAHAVTPNFGQGANSALEDSMVISQAVEQGEGDIETACKLFNEMRLADVRALVDIDRATLLSSPTVPTSRLTKLVCGAPVLANVFLNNVTAKWPEMLRVTNYASWMSTTRVRYSEVRAACLKQLSLLGLLALGGVAAVALLLTQAAPPVFAMLAPAA